MAINPNSGIPRVCLCAQARSGSSMMMHVLKAGGLIVDSAPEPPSEILALFRNPNGLLENRSEIAGGVFNNSFKLLDASKYPQVPSDYKIIFIGRALDEILRSWHDVMARGTAQGRNMTLYDYIGKAKAANVAWLSALSTRPAGLTLDYDLAVKNPLSSMQQVASFLQPFSFDVAAAVSVIDTSMYIDRSGA